MQAPAVVAFTVLPGWFPGDVDTQTIELPSSTTATRLATALRSARHSSLASRFTSTVLAVTTNFPAQTLAVQPFYNPSTSISTPSNDLPATTAAASPAAGPNPGKASANQTWPYSLILMLLVALVVYLVAISPILARYLVLFQWKKGWFLQSTPASTTTREITALPYPRPVRHQPPLTAFLRGGYNRILLPTVPFINLTIGQVLVLVVYLGCVVAATASQTGHLQQIDMVRSGRIAVAQLPVLFVLATKNNILSAFCGKSYAKLNFIHRFAGRSIIVLSAIHSVMYINKLKTINKLDLAGNPVQTTGLVAMCAGLLILLSSLQPIRKAAYQVFLFSHILGYATFVVATYMHVRYARPWIVVSLAFLALDLAFRLWGSRIQKATLIAREGGVTQVTVDGIRSGWKAGQHVWVRRLTAGHIWEAHPFSVANSAEYASATSTNSESAQSPLTLYAKSCGDWTTSLHTKAVQSVPLQEAFAEKLGYTHSAPQAVKICLDGPYGGQLHMLNDFESVLLVAGGSGITFLLNALEDLIASSLATTSATRRVKVVYVLRDPERTAPHFLQILESLACTAEHRTFLKVEVLVYNTSSTTLHHAKEENSFDDPHHNPLASIQRLNGRPHLTTCLNHLLNDTIPREDSGRVSTKLGGGVHFATCGPAALIKSARRAAKLCDQDLAYRAGGIHVHSETFGW